MRINVHAGHNPDGKAACGAVGFIQESTEARKVKDEVIRRLRKLGHTAYDCTCEDGAGQADVLTRIVRACNSHEVDLDVSIHFNAGASDTKGNGKTTGTEAYVYSMSGSAKPYAERICRSIAGAGFRNRGVKASTGLYFLRKTKAPAMLIECCFVDDKDDVELYDYRKMAEAIVFGITGQKATQEESTGEVPDPEAAASGAETETGDGRELYKVQVVTQYGAFSIKENAERQQAELKAAGFNAVIVKG